MAGSLIASKMRVPVVRGGSVRRDRLDGPLDRGVAGPLTLLSAPAGFGKTTLLADWLACTGRTSAAWLSLDERDGDPVRFWTYLVTALRTAPGSPAGFGDAALALLTAPRPSTEAVVTALLDDLAALRDDVVLVLDDLHVVDAREIRDGLALLLEHLPPALHLVVACRADPPFPLARMRARGELVEVRAAELRFTPDEVAAYLADAAGPGLAPADVVALEERTEGWIAALQLAALSLRGRADVGGFIARFAGDDRYVVDYLVEEVLRHLSPDVGDFLLRTAVLDRFTAPLCDAVTGRDDGARTLPALERANLFLVPLDDHREWYRYHHLFADVLRARIPAGRLPLLHRRAADWFERHDLVEESVEHALAAGDVDRAARLMERAVPAIRRSRHDTTFRGWLARLPDEVLRRSPVLGVFRGWSLMVAGDLEGFAARLDDAERALAAVPPGSEPPWADTEELHTLPATIAVYRASIAQARGDVAGTAAHARRALDLARPGDHLSLGSASGLLGLASWAEGDVASALRTFGRAVTSLRAGGNVVDELTSTAVLADMWLAAGRPLTARRVCERALRRDGGAPPAAAASLHVALSGLHREAGDLGRAREHLGTADALDDRGSVVEGRHRRHVAAALLAAAEGDPDAADVLLDRAEQDHLPGFLPDLHPVPAIRARILLRRQRPLEAADLVRGRGVTPDDRADPLREYDHLTLVRLLLARRRPDRATGLLERLLDAAQSAGRARSVLEIGMLQALALDARGDRPRARETLDRALTGAPETAGHVRLFLDEGTPVTDLLRDVERHGTASEQARLLLGPSPDVALTGREIQVLRLLDGELTGPQIARALYVTHNTLRTHTKHIFTKLDVTTRRAAVARARERGVL
ncbi:LuxR C-terminal-related transcriptional regulator [Pseudonocardia petroleophila]|uniref:Helix-turn-helix transcriptional regulator n=1 Tax=Pseudonocardia petroleophila TaxID=37331 RepID=A0A7G7MFF5_9PSEU|nr:LuxR C-terminal-related transcriptional regulator [Pseudonocardia petroleophila]QNG51516.1 helix-turn-helix transcriptional regulator [Pseudonocardia petroleophila]